MAKYASKVVSQAQAWLGKKESDGSFKVIIDTYNSHKPLARGYKVKYTDEWCATFVSAVSIKLGYTDIIPTECGCDKMISLFKKLNSWVENENCTPKAGWIIFYDWQDSGSGDNKGSSDHVGICEKVSNGVITVIEGNYNASVKRRNIAVNGKNIRGYGVPKYDAEPAPKPVVKTEPVAKTNAKVISEDGVWGKSTTKYTQKLLKTTVDGIVSSQKTSCKKYLPAAHKDSWEFKVLGKGSVMVKTLQKYIGLTGKSVDGLMGKTSVIALQKFLKNKKFYTGTVDGVMGAATVKAWQKYINSKF